MGIGYVQTSREFGSDGFGEAVVTLCARCFDVSGVVTSISSGVPSATSVERVRTAEEVFKSFKSFHLSSADKGKVEVFKKTGTEIGKQAAAKSGGLFSAEDWHCSS